MTQYEYKVVRQKMKLGFDYDKKLDELEAEWNQLGAEGWKFCTAASGVHIGLMRHRLTNLGQ